MQLIIITINQLLGRHGIFGHFEIVFRGTGEEIRRLRKDLDDVLIMRHSLRHTSLSIRPCSLQIRFGNYHLKTGSEAWLIVS
jgi:hypothetical protein